MRIMVLHHFYAQAGGEDAVVEAEARALQSRGHEVRLLARRSAQRPLGGALDALRAAENRGARRELARELDAFRPDVVHAHNLLPGWGFGVLRELIQRRQPAVQTQHNFRWLCAKATLLRDGQDCGLCAGGDFWPALRYACYRDSRILSAAYGRALGQVRRQGLVERAFQRLICVSGYVARTMAASGFDPARLGVKGHFVQEAPGSEGEGDGRVLFVGRLAEEKGFDVLANAALLLPGLQLSVVGEGPARARWEERLGPRAHWLGSLGRSELMARMRRSSACVVPSLGTETFGLVAMEAQACGIPVIVSDAGGLPERVRPGVDGWVFPKGDHAALAARLRGLLADPVQARSMGQAGLQKVRHELDAGSNMSSLETIYGQAIQELAK